MTDFRQAIENYIAREARPVDKFGHQPRLYALTQQVGAGHVYDDDVVFAAVWLHDLGVFIGHRPEDPEELGRWDNAAYAAERAPSLLMEMGFPSEKVNAVVEAIRTHQAAACPSTIEGVILRDADILEQLGAIGILRTVCKIGRDTRFSHIHRCGGVSAESAGVLACADSSGHNAQSRAAENRIDARLPLKPRE